MPNGPTQSKSDQGQCPWTWSICWRLLFWSVNKNSKNNCQIDDCENRESISSSTLRQLCSWQVSLPDNKRGQRLQFWTWQHFVWIKLKWHLLFLVMPKLILEGSGEWLAWIMSRGELGGNWPEQIFVENGHQGKLAKMQNSFNFRTRSIIHKQFWQKQRLVGAVEYCVSTRKAGIANF